jgi:chemotaxis protein MotB
MGRVAVALGAVCLVAATGCKSKMHDENLALHSQNRELQSELATKDAELSGRPDAATVAQQQAQLQQELAARDAKIAELEAQLRQPSPGQNDPGIAGIETSYDARTGNMTVNLPGDVLFDSGQATLKDSAKKTLDKVIAAVRKDYAGKPIFVEGHTDADPINKTRDKWEDNLDLSAARARAVAAYLTSNGIDSKSVGTRAYGPTKPRGSNKAQNRRVEIVVATK